MLTKTYEPHDICTCGYRLTNVLGTYQIFAHQKKFGEVIFNIRVNKLNVKHKRKNIICVRLLFSFTTLFFKQVISIFIL